VEVLRKTRTSRAAVPERYGPGTH